MIKGLSYKDSNDKLKKTITINWEARNSSKNKIPNLGPWKQSYEKISYYRKTKIANVEIPRYKYNKMSKKTSI